MAVKHYFGALLVFVILSSSVYFMLPDEVRIDIEKTRTKYSVYEDGSFVLAATEYLNLYDGTTKMRAVGGRELTWSNDSQFIYAVRTSKWKDNITTIQTYKFRQDTIDVRDFPSENTLECFNCQGKIVHYEIRDILYDGPTTFITTPFEFGHNMKIEWEKDYYYAKVFQQVVTDKIIIKYRPEESYEVYNVRLFDPPGGTYTGDSWDTVGLSSPEGITNNNTFFWITDRGDGEVDKYYMNGTYTGDSFDTVVGSDARGITNNNTFFWITDSQDAEVYKYYMNGTYIDSFDTAGSGNANTWGITNNNTFLWIVDGDDQKVYKYLMNGTFVDSFDTVVDVFPRGITTDNNFLWVVDISSEVYKYLMNGTYTGDSFSTSGSGNNNPLGITNNDTFFWITDTNDKVYKYFMESSPYTTIILQEADVDNMADLYGKYGFGDFVSQIRWNITNFTGHNIINATLELYLKNNFGTLDNDVNLSRIANQSWTESITASEFVGFAMDVGSITVFNDSFVAGTWLSVDVTDIISTDSNFNNNFSTIRFLDPDGDVNISRIEDILDVDTFSIGIFALTHEAAFTSKEYATTSLRPKLTVIYGELIISDTCTYDSGDWDIDCSDNCLISSQVNIDGNFNLQGSGTVILSSTLNFNSTGQKIVQGSGCTFVISSGGKIS